MIDEEKISPLGRVVEGTISLGKKVAHLDAPFRILGAQFEG